LPMVLKVPRLNFSPLALCDRPFSLLGFGDILVPGLLVAYCHRFDILTQSSRIYFVACTIAYGIGLLITFVALALMQMACHSTRTNQLYTKPAPQTEGPSTKQEPPQPSSEATAQSEGSPQHSPQGTPRLTMTKTKTNLTERTFNANLDSRKNREIEACVLTCTVRSLVGPLRLEAFLPSLGLRGQFGDLLLHDRRFVHLVGGADQLGLLPAELLLPFSARLLPLLHLRLQTFDLYPLPLPLLLPALLLVLMLSLQLVQVGHLGPLFLQVALLLLLQQHVAVVTSGLLAAGLESAEQLDLAVLLDDNYLYNEYKHTITSRMRVVQVIRSSLEPVWISYISGRLVGPEVVLVHSPTPGLRLQVLGVKLELIL
ncbi:hypothetical protein INR49_013205, partial [Caranx melampygus]